jgi:menaquinol-cytochrome c reductase iron-sulfur subunit
MVDMPLTEHPQSQETTRRGFFEAAIYGMMGLISVILAAPAVVYLLTPAKAKNRGVWAEAGDIGKLAPNSPVELVFRRKRFDGWREIVEKGTAWVVKRDDNRIIAFGPSCTHLGCAYHWDAPNNDFLCPCHTSIFSIDGKVISGPAPRPLDRFETRTEGSRLLIGELKRSTESQG